ncbi:MAG: aminomethyltransferase family protein, partial [Hyphomicrobiaceae bacterium]
STFGKIDVTGPDATRFLNRVCANNMDRAPGRAIYTAMLNTRGGIESDLTAVRLADDHYRLYVGTTALRRDLAWLQRHLDGARVELHDRTYDYAVIGLMGQEAARIAADLGADDLNTMKYFAASETTIANCDVLAVRLSYVGEAGWEITCRAEDARTLYDTIVARGVRPAGLFAQTAMRIEKRYLAYGHDLDTDVSPLQAGLDFAVAWDSDFIGRDALERQRDAGAANRIVSIVLDDAAAVPLGNEPVYLDDAIVGKTTSAAFGHRVGRPVAIADIAEPAARTDGVRVSLDIAGQRFAGAIVAGAAFDPAGARMRSRGKPAGIG